VVSPIIPPQPMIPPPMQRPPHRSIAGPVVLIIIGIIFLLATMGVLNHYSMLILFGHYWPALLILWGVIKMIEYEQAKRQGLAARGIGVGGFLLVVFLIIFGLIATQASRVNWKNLGEHIQLGDDEGIDEIFGGSTFDYSDELTQEIPAGSSLHIVDDRGAVTVNVSEGKTITVSVRKKVRAEKQQDADDYNNKTKPQITVAGKVVTVNADTQGAGDKSITTDMDISVPRNTDISIVSRRGDITISGMNGNADINHQRGEISVSDHTGNVSLTLEKSSVRLEHIKGDVTMQGTANEVDVEDIDGAVHLNGEYQETVRLVRVSNTVSFHSSRTDMEFARLDGRLDLDSGDLRADTLNGPMRLTTHSKDISLEGLSGDLRLEDRDGSVEVALRKAGNVQIDNRKGDVRVSIPPNTPMKIEARTREGEIQSDFEEIKVDNQDRQASASGALGNNGPRLAINCDKGDIEIRKGTDAPPAPPVPGKPVKAPKTPPAPKAAPVESEN
jgi:DUF4097 and DUF4098 domain-containing protein YvlB